MSEVMNILIISHMKSDGEVGDYCMVRHFVRLIILGDSFGAEGSRSF